MADPTIQTFCCHEPDNSDLSVNIMKEFNSFSYNTVCLVSSSIGISGAIYQILPRERPNSSHRWFSHSVTRGRHIVVWLAVADLLASIGVFARSVVWLNQQPLVVFDRVPAVLFCALSSTMGVVLLGRGYVGHFIELRTLAWIQYFYTATWLWTLCYAVDIRLVFRDKPGHPKAYHSICWALPAVLTTVGLTILYVPNANCHSLKSLQSALLRIMPNYLATYVPMAAVMIANPILYWDVASHVHDAVTRSLAQCTNKERHLVDTVRLKLALINLSFYLCWLPNLLNGILLWTLWYNLPDKVILVLWYIMAVMNPLQALFNCLVYRRWTGAQDTVHIPCRKLPKKKIPPEPKADDYFPRIGRLPEEGTPLLTTDLSDTTDTSINASPRRSS